jgi:hypothetical protein
VLEGQVSGWILSNSQQLVVVRLAIWLKIVVAAEKNTHIGRGVVEKSEARRHEPLWRRNRRVVVKGFELSRDTVGRCVVRVVVHDL